MEHDSTINDWKLTSKDREESMEALTPLELILVILSGEKTPGSYVSNVALARSKFYHFYRCVKSHSTTGVHDCSVLGNVHNVDVPA